MRILHLSDTHLTREPGPNADGVDTRLALAGLLNDCSGLPGLDAVLVTGDVADDGSPAAYADVRALVGEFADARGIPVLWTTGNHDERAAFAAALGFPAAPFLAASTLIKEHRVITLDTLVPGKAYGRLGEAQLDWLRSVLATPAPLGTVLAFHHPPIALDVEVQQKLNLLDASSLARAIDGTDVQLILTGHFHLQLFGLLDTVPVWVTPGVVNRIDLTAPPGTERAVRGASATLVDLSSPGSPLLHVLHARDPLAGQVAHETAPDVLARVITELGP